MRALQWKGIFCIYIIFSNSCVIVKVWWISRALGIAFYLDSWSKVYKKVLLKVETQFITYPRYIIKKEFAKADAASPNFTRKGPFSVENELSRGSFSEDETIDKMPSLLFSRWYPWFLDYSPVSSLSVVSLYWLILYFWQGSRDVRYIWQCSQWYIQDVFHTAISVWVPKFSTQKRYFDTFLYMIFSVTGLHFFILILSKVYFQIRKHVLSTINN